jgi:argininosuccinate lyase
VDWRLAEIDVTGSLVWAQALVDAGVLTQQENQEISTGLLQIRNELQTNQFQPLPSDEDVHSAVERRLTELVGPVGGKLHTGRSRNDQVATDLCLWFLQTIPRLDDVLQTVQASLISRANHDQDIIIPGYTHTRQAQPILLSHLWLSHFWPLARDRQRLAQIKERVSLLPLGSGALAGTPYPVNRYRMAASLGFSGITANSLDAVSNRDHAAEFVFWAALTATHLSRLAEQLILFSGREFGFFEIHDSFSTGSSLMPQKKNPDPMELTRAKTAVLSGQVSAILSMLKGLPSAYDKDLQEDKAIVFSAADQLVALLPVMAGTLDTLAIMPDRILKAMDPEMLATDLADYLVAKGMPFREAHKTIGNLIQTAYQTGKNITQLTLEQMQVVTSLVDADVFDIFNWNSAVDRRSSPGGTATKRVKEQIQQASALLNT